jgi:hypothetical protein
MVGEPVQIGVDDLDWDQQNVEHIARHDVRPEEVEFALRNDARFFLNKPGHSATHVMVGHDQWGRVLYVPILCLEWPGRWRVISAWESRFARKLLSSE